MQTRSLGDDGPQVSRIGFGTMMFGEVTDEPEAHRVLDTFTEAGGTLVDSADVYSAGEAERMVGTWLRQRPGARDRVVLATKARWPVGGATGGLTRSYLTSALEGSLQRLGTDHVDVWLAHGPDPETGIDELVGFLREQVDAGRVRWAGASNLAGWQLAVLAERCREAGVPLVAHQPQYSLLSREIEVEVLPAARHAGLGAMVWGPLGAGWLTGKYRRDAAPPAGSRLGDDPGRGLEAWDRRGTESTWAVVDAVRDVADGLGRSMAEVAVAWVADRPGVASALVGARSADQLSRSLSAADLVLDDGARARLDDVSTVLLPEYPYAFLRDQLGERWSAQAR